MDVLLDIAKYKTSLFKLKNETFFSTRYYERNQLCGIT